MGFLSGTLCLEAANETNNDYTLIKGAIVAQQNARIIPKSKFGCLVWGECLTALRGHSTEMARLL